VRLREAYLASAARNTLLMHQLGSVLHSLGAVDIQAVPLKGACLASCVYKHVGLRPMADLDILVKAADIGKAVEVVRALGYDSAQPFDPSTEKLSFQDMPPMSRRFSLDIEFHWTLVTPRCRARLDDESIRGLWERAQPATVAGVPVLVLSPEDQLLHLCMHLSVHHRFNGVSLKHAVDIAEVCRKYGPNLDWGTVAVRARAWDVQNGILVALRLAKDIAGACVPPSFDEELGADAVDDGTMQWILGKVINGSPGSLENDLARLQGSGSAMSRLGAARDSMLLPREAMARLYPAPADSWRIFAYYPVRWKDLWVRYRQSLWKLATRDKEFVEETRKEARLREYLGWK
jgi:hypothetical protein